jgi:hydrogenase maturation factor
MSPEASYLRVGLAIVSDIRNRQKVFQHPLIAYEIVALLHSPRCNIQKKLGKLELILGETEHAFVAHDYDTRKIPTSFLPL